MNRVWIRAVVVVLAGMGVSCDVDTTGPSGMQDRDALSVTVSSELDVARQSALFQDIAPFIQKADSCHKEFMSNDFLLGVVLNDQEWIQIGKDAVRSCIDQQAPDGRIGGGVTETFAFGHGLGESYLIQKEAGILDNEAELREAIRKAAEYVDANLPVVAGDIEETNIVAALAVFYHHAGIILNDTGYRTEANTLLDEVLGRQTSEGYFPEKGGPDTGYMRVTLHKLMTLHMHGIPDAEDALARGWEWELDRISHDGFVDVSDNTRTGVDPETGECREIGRSGKCKLINYPEMAWFLLMWHALSGDDEAQAKAETIIDNLEKGLYPVAHLDVRRGP